ncbi:transglutaminase domain-containing protein [candidate division KSB1 bacterium]|nr:transglutaminase domain-containing protein [candidate division KSB1 bacterium]
MRIILVVFLICLIGSIYNPIWSKIPAEIQRLLDAGEFTAAQKLLRLEIASNLTLPGDIRLEMAFEIERLERIQLDFTKTREDIIPYIQQFIPEVSSNDLIQWENEKSLEFMIIDGEKKYFKYAPNNLFRINKLAKARKVAVEKLTKQQPLEQTGFTYEKHIADIIEGAKTSKKHYLSPKKFRITYTLTVYPDVVPSDKVIRCWLPFPREIDELQYGIKIITTDPDFYILADNQKYLQRTIYFEKKAVKGASTQFKLVFEMTRQARYEVVDPDKITLYQNLEKLAPYLMERPPHIVFTENLRKLTESIVGPEKNPYLKAQKIFKWIDNNIPWASAREYSTIENLSHYAFENRHGDCGIQTMLFMTLCRMAGIPIKWQSGFTIQPDGENMHDWAEMYFEPYGWLPVDASYGIRNSKIEAIQWFYFGNTDVYRWVVNDDYSQPLFPAKIFPRSETIDFQRGEVEWEGGNLYFDKWNWNFEIEYLK